MSRRYDVAVIGAGVIGSAVAYQISVNNAGCKVALLEQYGAGHTRGSSHGGSRITRHSYANNYYTRMMVEGFPLWEKIQRDSGINFFRQTGLMNFAKRDSSVIQQLTLSMDGCGLKMDLLTAKEANSTCSLLNFPDEFVCMLEREAGILAASKAVTALQELFVRNGGELFEYHGVTNIVPGDTVTLETPKRNFLAKQVVITVGPWAKKFLGLLKVDVPLRTIRNESLYWKIDPTILDAGKCSTFILMDQSDMEGCYGIPEFEYPGYLKISYRSRYGIEVDPDQRDTQTTQSGIEVTKKFVSQYLNGVSTTPSIIEPCIVTKTPDNHFIVDWHPDHKNIIIGVGFTGHGFKLAPVIGKLISEMVLDLPLSYDIAPLSLKRFK